MEPTPYSFEPQFECLLVFACATRPALMGTIGRYLDASRLRNAGAALAHRAALEVTTDLGRGPTSYVTVAQRIRRWVEDGKVTLEAANAAVTVLVDASTECIPPDQEISTEVAPLLRRDVQADAVRAAIEEYQKRGDFERVTTMLADATRIGVIDTAIGTRLGPGSFDAIRELRQRQRIPTGVLELDAVLGGGAPIGTLNAWLGAFGVGKSTALTHVAAKCISLGLFVVEATLELPRGVQLARLKANLTGIPVDEIIDGDPVRCMTAMQARYAQLGPYIVKDFPAKATTAPDIIEWVEECERVEQRPVDVLIVDYADKLGSHKKEDRIEYAAQNTVWETLRIFVHNRSKWCWTATQAKRGLTDKRTRDKGRRTEGDDVADSINKTRVVDLMVAIDATPDGDQFNYHVVKNRYGRGGITVGPLPHDLACGRIAPVT